MPTIETVAALLAKAERTDSEAEAEAYLGKAQQLATLHAIDLATLAAQAQQAASSSVPIQRTIRIGLARKHANPHLVSLFLAIARHNDVVSDVARNSTFVIAYGLPDDIDTCESMWLAVAPHMVKWAQDWMRSRKWESDTRPGWTSRGLVAVPVTARTAKATFMVAFIERIDARLADARAAAIAEADAALVAAAGAGGGLGSSGAEVALVAKAEQVRTFHQAESAARGHWRGYGGALTDRNSASARAGDAAARTTRLNRDPEIGSARALDY